LGGLAGPRPDLPGAGSREAGVDEGARKDGLNLWHFRHLMFEVVWPIWKCVDEKEFMETAVSKPAHTKY
jgi:hypothetical protein